MIYSTIDDLFFSPLHGAGREQVDGLDEQLQLLATPRLLLGLFRLWRSEEIISLVHSSYNISYFDTLV